MNVFPPLIRAGAALPRRTVVLASWAFTAGSVALGGLLNQSYNPTVLNRYSVPWFAFLCAASGAFVLLAIAAWRSPRAVGGPRPDSGLYHLLVALAAASWGASLLTQYPLDPYHLRRPFLGEFFGVTQPLGVLLEYLAQLFVALVPLIFLVRRAFTANARGAGAIARALLVIAAVPAVYLVGEGALRLHSVVRPHVQGEPTKPTRLWEFRYRSSNRQGYGEWRFREAQFESRTRGDEFRVLVVGDSTTYGYGIPDPNHVFTNVLAAALRASQRFPSARVLNAGIPGTDSLEQLGILERLLWLNPDLVLLVYSFNDIFHAGRFEPPDTPFRSGSFWGRFRPARVLTLNSYLFDQALLRYRRSQGTAKPSGDDQTFRAYADPGILAAHLDVLAGIAQKAEAAGASFRLVPFEISVGYGVDRRYEERYRHFVEACLQRHIPIWSMARVFDAFAHEDLRVNRWDRHVNERAHLVVGQFLARQILSQRSSVWREARSTKNIKER